jgi:hypothetical protein
VWEPPGGAAGLTRRDDKHRAGSGGGDNPAHDAGTATEPGKPEVPASPDGGSAA